jgi:6-phosphogluconolactonase
VKGFKDNWLVFEDEILLADSLAQEILNIAEQSIRQNGCFNIVLTGGKSALNLYIILSKSNSDWDKWHIYIGDERYFTKNHKNRNDQVIREIWLDASTIPKKNIHFIKIEIGLLEAREEYEKVLKNIDKFDVVLLSMGEDGHIASLFPNHIYPEGQMVVVEKNSPKQPKERISLSYSRLNRTYYVFKLIIGESKQKMVALLKQNADLPVSRVNGECEKLYLCKSVKFIIPTT